MAAYPSNYGDYGPPSAPYETLSNSQPEFDPPPGYSEQPGYPAQKGYSAQPGYPVQPAYPLKPVVLQPGAYYPVQQPTQTIIVREKEDDDCEKECGFCCGVLLSRLLCEILCSLCLSDK